MFWFSNSVIHVPLNNCGSCVENRLPRSAIWLCWNSHPGEAGWLLFPFSSLEKNDWCQQLQKWPLWWRCFDCHGRLHVCVHSFWSSHCPSFASRSHTPFLYCCSCDMTAGVFDSYLALSLRCPMCPRCSGQIEQCSTQEFSSLGKCGWKTREEWGAVTIWRRLKRGDSSMQCGGLGWILE